MTNTVTPSQQSEFLHALPDLITRRREATLVKIFDRLPGLVNVNAAQAGFARLTVFQVLVEHSLSYAASHCLFKGYVTPQAGEAGRADDLTLSVFAAPTSFRHHLFSTLLHIQEGAFVLASAAFLAQDQGLVGKLIQRAAQAPACLGTAASLLEAMPPGSLRPADGITPQAIADALVSAIVSLPTDIDAQGQQKSEALLKLFHVAHTAGINFNCVSLVSSLSPISAACLKGNEVAIKGLLNGCDTKLDSIYFDGKSYQEYLSAHRADRPDLVDMITNELIKIRTKTPIENAAPSVHQGKQRTRRAV